MLEPANVVAVVTRARVSLAVRGGIACTVVTSSS
jgi:hypothetical protein